MYTHVHITIHIHAQCHPATCHAVHCSSYIATLLTFADTTDGFVIWRIARLALHRRIYGPGSHHRHKEEQEGGAEGAHGRPGVGSRATVVVNTQKKTVQTPRGMVVKVLVTNFYE